MELVLGSHVREHGNRVGRLAAFELEPTNLRIRRIIFSPDGELRPQTVMRPLGHVNLVHEDGELELRPNPDMPPLPAIPDVVLLSRAVRLRRGGRELGRFVGVDVNLADRTVTAVFGRHHWWSRRFSVPSSGLDCSTPGEIKAGTSGRPEAA
jgi:hypothetical protein